MQLATPTRVETVLLYLPDAETNSFGSAESLGRNISICYRTDRSNCQHGELGPENITISRLMKDFGRRSRLLNG